MSEKITKYERKAQYGGGAAHSNRNSSRWGNGGRRKVAGFCGLDRTDGTCALKPDHKVPLRPARQYHFEDEMYKRAPLKIGVKLHVWIDRVVLGIREVAIGLAEVVDIFWTGQRWIIDIIVNGAKMKQWLGLEEVMSGFVNWHKKRRQQKRSEGAGQVWTPQSTPSLQLLPASERKLAEIAAVKRVAGLLPAKCA